jgi:8-oxo-dGTP diphosphatase
MQGQSNQEVGVGVSVLIRKGDHILLEKRQNTHGAGTWGPPSGHINFGEAPEQTAVRETQEETGVSISDVEFRVITNDVFEAEQKHYITLWFEARYVSGEPRVNAPEEESEVGWFTWDALPHPLFLPLQHLLEGRTYPSMNMGSGRETPGFVPRAEALQ